MSSPTVATVPPPAPKTMAESLTTSSPQSSLLSLASSSEEAALKLAMELSASLSTSSPAASTTVAAAATESKQEKDIVTTTTSNTSKRYPIPLPESIQRYDTQKQAAQKEGPTTTKKKVDTDDLHGLDAASACAESILSSLSKIASGGSRASTEMRALEKQRREADEEADDVQAALNLRRLASIGADALASRRYADAAMAVRDYNRINATERAKTLAGDFAASGHERTRSVLRQAVLERYENAVTSSDVAGLSELTPLLSMLDLETKGVELYLKYTQSTISTEMDAGIDYSVELGEEEKKGLSRAAIKRKEAELTAKLKASGKVVTTGNVCQRLAKVFNTAVTHLRHHLPMVAYALGDADGDAALVQLVHLEVEKRAVAIIRAYAKERELALHETKAERIANLIEERYISGMGLAVVDESSGPLASLGLVGGGNAEASDPATRAKLRASQDDCGFADEVGQLVDVDAAMEEAALCLQHTESYERFIRHAVDEVSKARQLRHSQKLEEKRRKREIEEQKRLEAEADSGNKLTPIEEEALKKKHEQEEKEEEEEFKKVQSLEILPPHTKLNDIVAEVGGYYSGLERSLLLAGMQRAFMNANYPDERHYSPMAILSSASKGNGGGGGQQRVVPHQGEAGCNALQTSVIEECLYAAQRSTLRAFATGHTGTASAAANYCADILGRFLLEVLSRRAEMGTNLLKPGEGLLDGRGGLGQAAQNLMSTAQKGLRGGANVVRSKSVMKGLQSPASGGAGVAPEETPEEIRARISMGIARACANTNDLEVAIEYTRRLESKFASEIDSSYPRGHETEQLRMCVKSLGPVTDSFRDASNNAIQNLISVIMPRVRSIVNDAVGQDGAGGGVVGGATASFMPGAVIGGVGGGMGGGGGVGGGSRFNYDLDEAAFELAQISEGYMGRLCSCLDDLIVPLRIHLAPRLADTLVLGVLGGASKRIEAAIRRTQFTALGALSLDSDIRYFINYSKDRVDSPELKSNVSLCKACKPLARLSQIALLMNVDDLDDVLDLIASSKRKGNWDLKLDDAKAFLNLRVDFEGRKVNELLRMQGED